MSDKKYILAYRDTYFTGEDWDNFDKAVLLDLSEAESIARAMNSNEDLRYFTVVINSEDFNREEK